MQSTQTKKRSTTTAILYFDENCPQSCSCYVLIKSMKMKVDLQPIKKGDVIQAPGENINVSILPTFIDDQVRLSDSHTILLYLCDKYADVHQYLCPNDYLSRLNVLSMLFYEGCVLNPCYSQLLGSFELNVSETDTNSCRTNVLETYKYIDSLLSRQLCVSGNELSVADLCIISTLSGMNMLVPISMSQYPNLSKWFLHLKCSDWYKYISEGMEKFPNPLATTSTLKPKSVTPETSIQSMDKIENLNFIEMKLELKTQLQWPEKVSLRQKFFKIFSKERMSKSDIIQIPLPQTQKADIASAACSSQCCHSEAMIKRKKSYCPRLRALKVDVQSGSPKTTSRKRFNSYLPRARGYTFEVMSSNADLELKSSTANSPSHRDDDNVETLTKVEKLYAEDVDKEIGSEGHEEDEARQNCSSKTEDIKSCKSLTTLEDIKMESKYLECIRERAQSAEC